VSRLSFESSTSRIQICIVTATLNLLDASLWLNLWRIYPLLGSASINTFPRKSTRATIGRPLLGNGSINKPYEQYMGDVFCVVRAGGLSRDREGRLRELSRIGSSSGDGSRRWLRTSSEKLTRLCKEDFMCALKWHWDCDIRCQDTTSEDWRP
jgi:hypothetical protein